MAAASSTRQLLAASILLSLLLTSATVASGSSTAEAAAAAAAAKRPQQQLQWPGLCANSLAAHACRGFSARQPSGRSCHDQLLLILCSARSLRCPGQSSASLENPVCQQSCFRVFRRCRSSELSLYSYVNINDQLCASLPNQLCHDWREPSQRHDRSGDDYNSNICQAASASLPCSQVVYIGDVAERQRRGAAVRLRHQFRRSNFTRGNYTYAAIVKLAKVEWLQEAPETVRSRRKRHQQPPRTPPRTSSTSPVAAATSQPISAPAMQSDVGGYEKVLHLEIMRVLYTPNGRGGGHILEPGSVQIVRLKPNCACAPVKLDQSLIFVGYNSYLENVWKTVILLPNNGHYKCKIKRCWHKHKQRAANGGGGGPDCECPCGKSERRRCQKRSRRRQTKQRRGAAAAAAAAAVGGRRSADRGLASRAASSDTQQPQQLEQLPVL